MFIAPIFESPRAPSRFSDRTGRFSHGGFLPATGGGLITFINQMTIEFHASVVAWAVRLVQPI
jgi:hypothetical protein